MQCDMCGATTNLFRTKIEGTEMNLCSSCASYGKIISPVKTKEEIAEEEQNIRRIFEKRTQPEEDVEGIVADFAAIIRKKRESLGLKQEELARKLSEKESVIQKMESGGYTPSIPLARKLEKSLGITLIEKVKVEKASLKASLGTLTLGDIFKKQ